MCVKGQQTKGCVASRRPSVSVLVSQSGPSICGEEPRTRAQERPQAAAARSLLEWRTLMGTAMPTSGSDYGVRD